MGDYHLVRVWLLKPGYTGAELEELMASGYLEMQRWIPGVKHITLMRAGGDASSRYVLTTTFTSYQAYIYWRQVALDSVYWKRGPGDVPLTGVWGCSPSFSLLRRRRRQAKKPACVRKSVSLASAVPGF